MAKFFEAMLEQSSKHVEIKDMDAQVLRAMFDFIYTDMAPKFDSQPQPAAGDGEEKAAMA
nr:unnamed protein product [Digitaria exilis]